MTDVDRLKAEASEEGRHPRQRKLLIAMCIVTIVFGVIAFGSLLYAYSKAHQQSNENAGVARLSKAQAAKLASSLDRACELKSKDRDSVIKILCHQTESTRLALLEGRRGPRGPRGPVGPAGPLPSTFVFHDLLGHQITCNLNDDDSTYTCVADSNGRP